MEMTDVFSVTGSRGSSRGLSRGFTTQLGPLCLKHQPPVVIFTANNLYDEAYILK